MYIAKKNYNTQTTTILGWLWGKQVAMVVAIEYETNTPLFCCARNYLLNYKYKINWQTYCYEN